MAGWFGDDIDGRKDFLHQLAKAREQSTALAKKNPRQSPLKYVAKQLDDVARWTA